MPTIIIETPDVILVIEQPQIVCDFCSSSDVVARYHADDFTVNQPGPQQRSVGDWSACSHCSELIDAGNWPALIEHAVKTFYEANPELKHIPIEFTRENPTQMYSQLRSANLHKGEL